MNNFWTKWTHKTRKFKSIIRYTFFHSTLLVKDSYWIDKLDSTLSRSTYPTTDPVGSDHPTRSDRILGNRFESDSDCPDSIGSDDWLSITKNLISRPFPSTVGRSYEIKVCVYVCVCVCLCQGQKIDFRVRDGQKVFSEWKKRCFWDRTPHFIKILMYTLLSLAPDLAGKKWMCSRYWCEQPGVAEQSDADDRLRSALENQFQSGFQG